MKQESTSEKSEPKGGSNPNVITDFKQFKITWTQLASQVNHHLQRLRPYSGNNKDFKPITKHNSLLIKISVC